MGDITSCTYKMCCLDFPWTTNWLDCDPTHSWLYQSYFWRHFRERECLFHMFKCCVWSWWCGLHCTCSGVCPTFTIQCLWTLHTQFQPSDGDRDWIGSANEAFHPPYIPEAINQIGEDWWHCCSHWCLLQGRLVSFSELPCGTWFISHTHCKCHSKER